MLLRYTDNARYWCSGSSVRQPHRPVYRNSIHLQRADNPSRTQNSGRLTTHRTNCGQRWALSQITENRKVETHKPLIFRDPIFGFCLQKATLRQSLDSYILLECDFAVSPAKQPS
jgi:hypothetical protein